MERKCVLSHFSCVCDSADCNLPGSSVHGILQASILDWIAMPSFKGIFLTQGSNLHLSLFFFFILISLFFLFVVNFVIHWNETAIGLHVFPIPIPPPTSLSTRSP